MIRDYTLTSPSLDGILSHSSLSYEGLDRPTEILTALDGPSSKGSPRAVPTEREQKVLADYFSDLHGIFLKKLSAFALAAEVSGDETLKLQAMLQEMIKVKALVGKGVKKAQE